MAGHRQDTAETHEEVQPEATNTLTPEGTQAPEVGREGRKLPSFLTVFPAAVAKFTGRRKKKGKKSAFKDLPDQKVGSEEPCGLGCVIIPFCQRFNSIRCFLICYCSVLIAQGILFDVINLSISNVQKNYLLKPSESLALSFSYDLSSCLAAIFVGYYGGRGHRVRWIAFSSFLVGSGSLLLAYPYFGSVNIHLKGEVEELCSPMKIVDVCLKARESFQTKHLVVFILEQMMQGIARLPLFILGVTFLYDSVDTHSAGTYLGIAEASSVLGYALGYTMGVPHLKRPENNTSEHSSKYRGSEHWFWSWWLDFLVTAVISWTVIIPLLCFPQNIRGTAEIKAKKQKQLQMMENKLKNKELGRKISDLCSAVLILMKNPVFVCLSLSKATEHLIRMGAFKVLPIYLSNQFILTPQLATTLAGLILLPGGAVGYLLGGVIVSKLHMSCKALMIFTIVTCTVSLILFVLVTFISCDPGKLAGINEDYDGTGQLRNLSAPCNADCKCSSLIYSSICGRDDIEYFSPCFGGCRSSKQLSRQKTYYNCSCVKEGLVTADEDGDFIDARAGKCDAKCYKLPLFIAFIFSTIVFTGFSGVPVTLAILRIVPNKLHSVALGITFVILRIFGTMPAPSIFKMTIESSCIFRDDNQCGRTGNCWIYNKTRMIYTFVGMCK
ncbi:solute carrier organic anion transporter family member 6A1 [Tupaia chinensis]|uniref:solute carrier organic anion transporter family member 6A1 n=1 Tax=Tupaia chinensis TaxID=246437 RepID=UPI0007045E29|nr:solute carrier organic anion transporter family member 6A1 [Tupaia chinensis]